MKKKWMKKLICFLLAMVMITETTMVSKKVYASEVTDEEIVEEPIVEEVVNDASCYLYPFEEAVHSLDSLAKTRELQAVIYLSDEVYVRMVPQEGSEPVKMLASGDVVSIVGVGQDSEYNIWYRIIYKNELEEVTGYVKKENIVCVDQEFLKWEESYVRSISMFTRLASGVSYADIEMFPESYQSSLKELKAKHPNWIFVKMNTNIDWKTLVNSQLGERSLIYTSTSKESWKNGRYGTTAWSYASEGILKYYLEPRNWLAEKDVFQFELLGYYSEYHTVEAVESILSGSFMANKTIDNGKTYAQTFVELGKITGVSPFLMATRVRQEQGAGGNSALISGTYQGYEGYYNYYNISAAGTSDKEVIVSGLEKAKQEGWDSQYKALKAGAEFLGKSYIKAGQDTLYLQKFDVDNRNNGVFWHQYMQNIQAPYTEGRKVYQAYSNKQLLNQAFVFRIPVYNNMPKNPVVLPGEEDKITLSSTSIDNLQVNSEITLRPYINGKEAQGINWSFTSSDTNVVKVDNYGVVKALKTGEATITCKNVDDPDNPNVGSCKIKVIKADLNIEELEMPKLQEIEYDPNQTLSDISLPKGYSWVNPEMKPIVDQSTYGVIYNPDEENYNSIVFDIGLNVIKRKLSTSDYTIPTGLEGGAARQLSSIMLPNGFLWNDPEEKLEDTVGIKTYLASYNPDNANYETVTDIAIQVKIVCEKHYFSEWEITDATCEENGVKIRECSICDSKEELLLEKKGHIYESVVTEEATEEQEGIRTYSCKNCDSSYTENIPKLPSAHVHKYESGTVKKASCLENGEIVYECECGDKYIENQEALGHKMEQGRCQRCGYTVAIEEIDQNGEKQENDDTNKETQDDKNSLNNKDNDSQEQTNSSNVQNNQNMGKEENAEDVKNEANIKEENKQEDSNGDTKKEESIQNVANSNEQQNKEIANKAENETEKPSKPSETEKENVHSEDINQVEAELMAELIENANKNGEEAKKQTISIQLNKNTEISKTIVSMAKEHGVDLEVKLPNDLKWTVFVDSLNDVMPYAIDMNAKIVKEVIDERVLSTVVEDYEYMELSLSHDGEFGFEATLTIPVEEKYVGKIANLFYYNEKNGELEFQMATEVDEENQILLNFNHASDYVIVFADQSMEQILTIHNDEGVEETGNSQEITRTQMQTEGLNKLLIIFFIVMVISGIIAVAGYFLYFKEKKEKDTLDSSTFEEWLKEEPEKKLHQVSKKIKEVKNIEGFLDDDVDDYKEKPTIQQKQDETAVISTTIEAQDYLDDDVDDYQEKS
ncbi:MAG: hypothetical protein IKW30_02370 [Lachnospiraceae bacterium]|nr:hypothetical protein [Lachnospiraceae bacterium]